MQINQGDKFWIVVDARPISELDDILFDTTIDGLERQFKGGLTSDDNITIFSDHKEAEQEAQRRLRAVHITEAIKNGASAEIMKKTSRIELKSSTGDVVFEVDL